MKKLIVVNAAIVLALLINSCATSNDVVSNRLISKRKYTKGLFIKKNLRLKSDGVEESDNVAMVLEENSDEQNVSSNPVIADVQKTSISDIPNEKPVSTESVSNSELNAKKHDSRSIRSKASLSIGKSDNNRVVKKEFQKAIKQEVKAKKAIDTGDPVMLVILIILAIVLPPVAVAIYRGIDNIFWLDLILFLVGIFGFWFLPIAGLSALAAVIIALLVIFDVI